MLAIPTSAFSCHRNEPAIVERLKKGSLDLGFVHLPVSDEEIHIIDSRTSPYCAVVGTAFADWARRPLRTEELTELPSCCYPWRSTRSFIEGWFRSQGVEAEADFELNSLDMLAEFAERGYGTAFLPRAFVASRISDGSLLELRTETPLPDRYIGVAVRKQVSPSLAAGAFWRSLRRIDDLRPTLPN